VVKEGDVGHMRQHPAVLTFPFLSLRDPVEFGSWWLGSVDHFRGPWLSGEFEAAARRFLSAFRDAGGEAITGGALLANGENGADGQSPSAIEAQAIELSVGFATIDQNPYWTPAASGAGWRVATTDNAAFWVQPLNLAEGWISLGRGSRVSITAGGGNLKRDDFTIRAPLELNRPSGVTLDQEVLGSIYDVLTEPSVGHEIDASRLKGAIRWLLRSWQNTPSITWEDRLVFLKVATEALTAEDRTVESAKKLEALFERAANQDGGALGTDDLLWQAGQPSMLRSWTTRSGAHHSDTVSAFVHWLSALGDARNALVHGEDGTSLDYHESGSAYDGPFVEVGDRVLREAVLLALGECGYPAVWRRGMTRASFKTFQHLASLSFGARDETSKQIP
jgi:hypothetical protein